MRSTALDLSRYDTDKVENRYLERYDPVFADLVERPLSILEIGVKNGGSVLLWRDYFPHGEITGIDLRLPKDWTEQERIRLYSGSQGDTQFLSSVARERAPDGFDVIIDDASHLGHLTRTAFWHLFEHHLRPGGIYAIEDWGTGYWSDFPDGASLRPPGRMQRFTNRWLQRIGLIPRDGPWCHAFGMVGLVKELVDEMGAAAISRQNSRGVTTRTSRIATLMIKPGITFALKRE